jgi:outer membrane receptor protein involved in Fe transport
MSWKVIAYSGTALIAVASATAASAQGQTTTTSAQQDPVSTPSGDVAAAEVQPANDGANVQTPEDGLTEIIVTAQKRSERIQSVPIAISAFTNETLQRQHIDSGLDLQLLVPNLLIVGNDRPTIRGVGNNAISPTADNGTGVLFNFAPIGVRPQDEFYDVERIEVLRGPQGTLYGRNTTGGTINLITQKPSRTLGGYINAQIGNYETRRLQGAINLPLNEVVQVRLAGFYLKREGYTKNLFTGNSIDGRDQYSVRGSVRLQPTSDTRLDVVVQRSKEDSSRSRENKRLCKATPVLGCSPTELGFDSPNVSGVVFQRLLANFFTGTIFPAGGNIYAGALNPTDLRSVAADTDSTFEGYQNSVTAELTQNIGPITLTSLSAYTKNASEANTDYDNAALPFRFLRPITYRSSARDTVTTDRLITTDSFLASGRTYYQEFRAASDFKGPFNFTAGLNFFDAKGSATFQIYHPAVELAATAFGLPAEGRFFNAQTPRATTKSTAVFGEGYVKLTEATKLTAGLRYTKDRKSIRTRTIFLGIPPFTEAKGSYDAITGRLVVDHRLTRSNLLYASYSRGFKGGGLNVGNATTPTFEPEYINAFEVGSKNQFFGDTLQANFSGFYYDYKNLQLGQRLGTSTITVNSNAKVRGLESEFLWAPVKPLLINANLSYLHTRIGNLQTIDPANPAQFNGVGTPTRTPAVPINLAGKRLPYSPKVKLSLGAQYTVPTGFSGWSATLRGDYSRQSSYFAREFNTSNDRIAAWSVANAFLRFTNQPETVTVEAFVKNIGNKDNITNSIIESDLVGSYRNARILDPRTYGLVTTLKF